MNVQPDAEVTYDEAQIFGQCTYCGDPIDYCQGHGEIGDPRVRRSPLSR